ncbi:hypothetical protein FRC09_000009 [Ceratobasidium sp. 395]|nr:hypothetical protein FRC09_000009 [Ceratobasidium sp. 395]
MSTFNFPPEIDLSRVSVYSPFVRTLNTAGSYTIYFPHTFWEQACIPPFLPNLQRLVINVPGSIKGSEQVDWIPRLLHEGLLGLEMYSFGAEKGNRNPYEIHAWLGPETCFNLVNQLAHTCPRLETLRLYPAGLGDCDRTQLIVVYMQLAQLTCIRSLTFGGTVALQELYTALGQLPHLETLSLRTDASEAQESYNDPIIIPDNSFPSLRQLDLYQLNESAMARICKITQIFRRLVSASIIYKGKPNGRHDFGVTHRYNRSEVAVACLGANSPHIEYLTVLPEGDGLSNFLISWTIIDKLRLLPLKYLKVGRIKLNIDIALDHPSDDQPTWGNLLVAVPQLEELHMDTNNISLNELQLIGSKLSKLRLLAFWHVGLQEAGQPPETISATQSIVLRSWSYFGAVRVPGNMSMMPMMTETPEMTMPAWVWAIGLGPPPGQPGLAPSTSTQQQRRISRALSYAIEVEGVVSALVEEEQ